jgi:hypothetical protein
MKYQTNYRRYHVGQGKNAVLVKGITNYFLSNCTKFVVQIFGTATQIKFRSPQLTLCLDRH